MDFERVILCSFTSGMHSTGIYSIESGVHGQIICTLLSSIQFHLPPTSNINTTQTGAVELSYSSTLLYIRSVLNVILIPPRTSSPECNKCLCWNTSILPTFGSTLSSLSVS